MALEKFSEFHGLDTIEERFINALPGDDDLKKKHADAVWKILQDSYASIGGIKGKGFSSKDDILNIPMWKMIMKNGVVKGVVMYKDKSGRKSVAAGTDGSDYAKLKAADIVRNDLQRSYGEKSKASLGLLMKQYPFDVIEPFIKTPEQAKSLLKKPDVVSVKKYKGKLPADALVTLSKYPRLKDYAYMREINGEQMFKVLVGTPGKTIK